MSEPPALGSISIERTLSEMPRIIFISAFIFTALAGEGSGLRSARPRAVLSIVSLMNERSGERQRDERKERVFVEQNKTTRNNSQHLNRRNPNRQNAVNLEPPSGRQEISGRWEISPYKFVSPI